MAKKLKKYEKKMEDALHKADQASALSVLWEERFLKSVTISEELITRVKR